MLSEVALTPQLLEQSGQVDTDEWIEQLRRLLSRLRPRFRQEPNPLVIANLHDGDWYRQLNELIDEIGDHRARRLARDIRCAIQEVLVQRPSCRDELPYTAEGWTTEAVASHQQAPIDRIITTTQSNRDLSAEDGLMCCMDEIDDEKLWDFVSPSRSPAMRLAEQVEALRPFWVHSKFIAMASPYFLSSESALIRKVLEKAVTRHAGFEPLSHFDVHTTVKDDELRDSDIERGRLMLSESCGGRVTSRLFIWRKFVKRVLLAGDRTRTTSDGGPRVSWGVSFDHIVSDRRSETEQANWFLLNANQVIDNRLFFYGSDRQQFLLCPAIVVQK